MLKVLVWIVSNDSKFFNAAINILERQNNGVEVVGVTATAPVHLVKGDKNIPFVPLNEANWGGDDVLFVAGAKIFGMGEITRVARQLNLPDEKLLGDWIVCIPGFTLEKYRRLQRSCLSILSINCFGGMLSHALGLPFRSPFVNLRLSEKDFLNFLQSPRLYIDEEPRFEKLIGKSLEAPDGYPLLSLADISLNMMHYKDAREAIDKWNERKRRINRCNLFVTMFTEDEKILREFDALPYGKKVCFVPFKSDLDSAWYINPEIDKQEKRIDGIINNFVQGKIFYYDVFDMLLYGKKTPLIEM